MTKVVLITGASSGIGRATAELFLDEEWTVYATARDTDDVADLATHEDCETRELDVTKPAQCKNVVDDIVETEGRLDCLVNNAGFGQLGALEDLPTRKLHRQFDVNVYGPHRLVRAALPHMREREDGTIVNVSSVSGRVSTPGMGAYSGSKFALEAMSDALRGEVDAFDIDVCLVEPGPVDTGFGDRATAELDDIESTGVYDHVYSLYEDYVLVSGAGASDPSEVADCIVDAAVSPDPPARYPVGRAARLGALARFVPDRIRDKAFSLAAKFA